MAFEAVAETTIQKGTAGRRFRLPAVHDRSFRALLAFVAVLFCAICVALVVSLVIQARPAFAHFGFSFLTGTKWDPVHAHYGALVFIVGTLETTAIAMVLAIPIGLGTALCLVHVLPPRIRASLSTAVELLAAVPSVVYGLWALLVVAPWVRSIIEPALASITGGTGPFSGTKLGFGMLLAGLVLFVMVLPTMVAISRDVITAVPSDQIEAAYALGATRWQMMWRVVLPSARVGLLGAGTLAMGRALGETIAVTMVIGNSTTFAHSLFAPGATLASIIANQFTEATEPFHLASLVALGVVLLVVAIIVNTGARLLVRSIGNRGASSVALV